VSIIYLEYILFFKTHTDAAQFMDSLENAVVASFSIARAVPKSSIYCTWNIKKLKPIVRKRNSKSCFVFVLSTKDLAIFFQQTI
jgi:hypothetical protein